MLKEINHDTTLAPSLTPVAEIVITAAGVKPRHQQAVTALLKSVVKHINCSGGMGSGFASMCCQMAV